MAEARKKLFAGREMELVRWLRFRLKINDFGSILKFNSVFFFIHGLRNLFCYSKQMMMQIFSNVNLFHNIDHDFGWSIFDRSKKINLNV